jgi:hypothetical protein
MIMEDVLDRRSDFDILDSLRAGYVNNTATYSDAGISGFISQSSNGIFSGSSIIVNSGISLFAKAIGSESIVKKQLLNRQAYVNGAVIEYTYVLPPEPDLTLATTKNVPVISYGLKVENYIQRYYEELLKNWGFELEDSMEIISFLLRNLTMLSPLEESKERIEKYFVNSKLQLSLYKDIEEQYQVLNILILNEYTPEEALFREESLFEEWFKKYYIAFKGRLSIRECPII